MIKRSTRAERSAENRDRVLAAARDVFLRKGFHAASLDQIAERAGFSKGVVYSQFGGKDDLFLALLEQRIESRARQNLEAARQAPAGSALHTMFRLSERTDRADDAWTLLVIEYRVHAARDPELNRRYAALHDRALAGVAEAIEVVCERDGFQPAYTFGEIARLILALGGGYTLEHLVAPSGATYDVAREAVACLLGRTGREATSAYAPGENDSGDYDRNRP